jgi:hypothetical protein
VKGKAVGDPEDGCLSTASNRFCNGSGFFLGTLQELRANYRGSGVPTQVKVKTFFKDRLKTIGNNEIKMAKNGVFLTWL